MEPMTSSENLTPVSIPDVVVRRGAAELLSLQLGEDGPEFIVRDVFSAMLVAALQSPDGRDLLAGLLFEGGA